MVGEKPHSIAHSVARHQGDWSGTPDDARLSAPSARRNTTPIIEALRRHVPETGYGLEIASGTGEHAIAYARAFPGVVWQPTDVSDARLDSIDAWRAQAGLRNMRLAQYLDVTDPAWQVTGFDVIVTVNLMHLIGDADMRAVIAGVARSLQPGGRWCLYGPFRSGGGFRSEADLTFHTRLREDDPMIGYKDIEKVAEYAEDKSLVRTALIDMPANNLMAVFEKRP